VRTDPKALKNLCRHLSFKEILHGNNFRSSFQPPVPAKINRLLDAQCGVPVTDDEGNVQIVADFYKSVQQMLTKIYLKPTMSSTHAGDLESLR